jgi:hypothetical protein
MEYLIMVFFLICLATVIALAAVYHVAIIALLWTLWYAITHLGVITYVVQHPWQTAAYASGYFVIGGAWSIAKWWFAETNAVRAAKERYDSSVTIRMTWDEYRRDQKTNLRFYKPNVMFWIGGWPLSAIYTLLDDPIRRLCRRIYYELQGVYQRITDHVWDA